MGSSTSTLERCQRALARTRRRTIIVGLAVAVSSLALFGAASAQAGLQKEFEVFAQCPLTDPAVNMCVQSTVTSGQFKLGSKTVPINKTVTLQGGLTPSSEELVPAANGETLSKTPLVLPGGLIGLEVLPPLTEVTATAELAGPVLVNVPNFGKEAGTAVTLPLKVKLDNPLLLNSCYVGSESEPVMPHLTTGTTASSSPISGTSGTLEFQAAGKINVFSNSSLVDNTFPAPGANGCAGPLALVVDPAVDLVAGLPAGPGTNNAILNGTLKQSSAITVKRQREIPEIGRCLKVASKKEGKVTVYDGHYVDPGCVREFPTPPSTVGKYEWTPGAAAKQFSGGAKGGSLETVGKRKIACLESTNSGEFTGLRTATLGITFTGCKLVSNKETCQSSGAGAGEIKAPGLQGELGYIKDVSVGNVLTVSVGFDLAHEPTLISGACGGESVAVSGSVIAPVAIDKMATSNSLQFKATAGKQAPESFEEAPKDVLSAAFAGGSGEQAGLTTSEKLNFGEKLEIKAIAE
ncbi:MAG TPA: hypothetical protein VGN13_02120 [Solirubrobacteraceae bacterium]|jgi:hypothetical protein